MYLFVRRGRLAGGQTRASMMWATEITERVNQVTGLGVSLHMQMFSAEVGELVWATMVPDLATLETGFEKLQVDDFYIAEQDRAHGFMEGPPTDVLEQVIHGEPVDLGPGSYTFAGTAVLRPRPDGRRGRGRHRVGRPGPGDHRRARPGVDGSDWDTRRDHVVQQLPRDRVARGRPAGDGRRSGLDRADGLQDRRPLRAGRHLGGAGHLPPTHVIPPLGAPVDLRTSTGPPAPSVPPSVT